MAANEKVQEAAATFPDEHARLPWGVMKARSLPDAMALEWTDEKWAAHCVNPPVLAALSYA
jgi:hypothetical protein